MEKIRCGNEIEIKQTRDAIQGNRVWLIAVRLATSFISTTNTFQLPLNSPLVVMPTFITYLHLISFFRI